MSSYGTPPTIPTALQQYKYVSNFHCSSEAHREENWLLTAIFSSSSYVVDPIWQRRFSAIWATFAAVAILVSLPHFIRSLKHGRSLRGLFGVSESLTVQRYTTIGDAEVKPRTRRRVVSGIIQTISSLFWWSLPGIGLTLGQSL